MNPSVYFLSTLAALAASSIQFWLYRKLKAEFRKMMVHMATQDDIANTVSPLADQITALEGRFEHVETGRREQEEWITGAESLNLNRRGQVLRLHKRGESVPEIASALRVGQGEVRLIIKVFELTKQNREREGADTDSCA